MRTLVLGLGNDLYGDDAVGLEVVRRLREEAAPRPGGPASSRPFRVAEGTVFEECCLSGLSLLDVITGYDRLVIIDTIKKRRPLTGRVRILGADDLRAIPGPSPHYVSVPQMIEMGRQLGLCVPTAIVVVAVEAKDMVNLGEGLSEDMTRALPAVVDRVKAVLEGLEARPAIGRDSGAKKRKRRSRAD